MKITCLLAVAALASHVAAIGVSGAAEGFAQGVTGGGSAEAVTPTTIHELVSYLEDNSPRVVILTQTFDFRGSEGTTTGTGCAPSGTGAGCQLAIDMNNWCQSDLATFSVEYDSAGVTPINVASDKTIIGAGSAGIIQGKGLRIANGANNIIVQNIAITDINSKFIWGGDAVTIDGADLIWIDHVTTARIGRQHIVLGTGANHRVTLSNNYIDGETDYSPYCDGYHYWTIYLDGSSDTVTMMGNYIYHTSGRSPRVSGNTLLHIVNNYWYQNSHYAFEIAQGGSVLAEGNVFKDVNTIIKQPVSGALFTSPNDGANAFCTQYIGRPCVANGFDSGSSSDFAQSDNSFLSDFAGKNVTGAASFTGVASNVSANAGQGKL